MTPTQLRKELRERVCEFSFVKKDGTTRVCKGTTNAEIISSYVKENKEDSQSKRSVPSDMIIFFDMDKLAFRSLRENQLICE